MFHGCQPFPNTMGETVGLDSQPLNPSRGTLDQRPLRREARGVRSVDRAFPSVSAMRPPMMSLSTI